MKRTILVYFFALSLINCGFTQNEISDFDKELGQENAKVLSDLVQLFENEVLQDNYAIGSLSQKYKDFAVNCYKVGAPEALPKITSTFKEFRKSQLWNEIFAQVDSTWLDEYGGLQARVIYNSQDGVRNIGETGWPTRNVTDLDSLHIAVLNWQVWNHQGRFIKALEKVKNSNSFVKDYYEAKTTFGGISSHLFCDMIIEHEPDFNDYLVKRVIAVELARIYVLK